NGPLYKHDLPHAGFDIKGEKVLFLRTEQKRKRNTKDYRYYFSATHIFNLSCILNQSILWANDLRHYRK
ncbi:MAG TPA: hypothetical protein VF144_16260, partial [Chitinophagaceae bacterium]